jgi:hypothetical protein
MGNRSQSLRLRKSGKPVKGWVPYVWWKCEKCGRSVPVQVKFYHEEYTCDRR